MARLILLSKHTFFRKYSREFRSNNCNVQNSTSSDEIQPNTIFIQKPLYSDISDELKFSFNHDEEFALEEHFKKRSEFLKTNKKVYFGDLGYLSSSSIYLQLLHYFRVKLHKNLADLYALQFLVLNFIIPKIDWIKENYNGFSSELKWLINLSNKTSVCYWDFRDILDLVFELFGIKISNYWDISKVEDISCFDIYKQNLLIVLEHLLSNYRIFLGRPAILKTINIIWDHILIENNPYIQEYRISIIEVVGLESLLC